MSELIYKNVMDISVYVKDIIDKYWRKDLSQQAASQKLKTLFAEPENRALVFRGDDYSSAFKSKLGKRRFADFEKLLM